MRLYRYFIVAIRDVKGEYHLFKFHTLSEPDTERFHRDMKQSACEFLNAVEPDYITILTYKEERFIHSV